jgi:putative RecB family exonuclease
VSDSGDTVGDNQSEEIASMAADGVTVDVVTQPGATLPRRVSYSQMSLYQQCPLKYYFSYFGGWKERPSQALVTGSISHEVIEHLYRLDPADRTVSRAIELLREHGMRMLRKPEFEAFADDNEMKHSIRTAVENLFAIESPQEVAVQPEHLEMELAVEINGVNFFGKVDRFTCDGVNRVTDYKTGRSPGKFVDDRLAQPYLYALAFRLQYGIEIDEVELIFLHAKEVIRRPIDESTMLSLGDKLATMRSESQRDYEASAWAAKPQRLCDYCKFKKACKGQTPDAPIPGSPESDAILLASGDFLRSSIGQ